MTKSNKKKIEKNIYKSKISKKELLILVAKATKSPIKKVNEKSNSDNLKNWDSMSHLNILVELDKRLSKKARDIDELSSADSVKKIISILNKNKLISV